MILHIFGRSICTSTRYDVYMWCNDEFTSRTDVTTHWIPVKPFLTPFLVYLDAAMTSGGACTNSIKTPCPE